MKTLVIIPAYNEAPNIVHTVESLKAACPDVDYVVVNDCSGDDTAKICEEHGYTYLNLPINLGIGGGMQTGYRYASEMDMILQFRWMEMDSTMRNIFLI